MSRSVIPIQCLVWLFLFPVVKEIVLYDTSYLEVRFYFSLISCYFSFLRTRPLSPKKYIKDPYTRWALMMSVFGYAWPAAPATWFLLEKESCCCVLPSRVIPCVRLHTAETVVMETLYVLLHFLMQMTGRAAGRASRHLDTAWMSVAFWESSSSCLWDVFPS